MKDDDLIRNINPFGLRMQPTLKARIEEAAQANHRSLNAEITARLEESFSPRSDPISLDTLGEAIDLLMAMSKASGLPVQVIIGDSDEKDQDDD